MKDTLWSIMAWDCCHIQPLWYWHKDLADTFPYHIFPLYSSENSKKMKGINTTDGEYSKYYLNEKKKKKRNKKAKT